MKKTLKSLTPVLLVFIGLLTMSFAPSDDNTIVKLNVKKGQTFTVKGKQSQLVSINAQGMNMNIPQNTELRQTLKVKDAGDKSITIATTLDVIKFSMSQMGMKLTYDSEHPEKTSPMLAGTTKTFDDIIGKECNTVYDYFGNLVKATESDGATNNLVTVIIPLPKEGIRVGSQWTQDTIQSVSNININVRYLFKVTDISKKTITLQRTIAMNADTDTQNASMTMNGEGTFLISRATGIATKITEKTNCSMTMEEQGLTIPMTVTISSDYTIE